MVTRLIFLKQYNVFNPWEFEWSNLITRLQFLQCELLFIQCNTKPLSMCVRTYVSYTTYLVHYNAVLCHTYFCVPEAFSFLSIVVFTHSILLQTGVEISSIWCYTISRKTLEKIYGSRNFSTILVFEYNGV